MDIFDYKIKLTKFISELEIETIGDYTLYRKKNSKNIEIERCNSNHLIAIKNNNIVIPLLKEVGYNDTIFILNDILSELNISNKHTIKINYIKL